MKSMRITLLSALLTGVLFAGAPAMLAQETKDAPKREGRAGSAESIKARLDQMAKNLNLTESQKTKVGEALKAQIEKMRELRSAGGTPEANREKFRALREENDKKMKEILTAEQYEKWLKERPQGRGPGGPGKRSKKAETN